MQNEKARRLFPAASNGEYGIPPEMAPVMRRGCGCRIWDTAGREYLDMTMAWGAALVGHGHPEVVDAAFRKASDGINFAALNSTALELGERIAARHDWIERLRFVTSGTEATMLCLRVARGATGRRRILKFEGAYHGQHPEGVASMVRNGELPIPECDTAGTGAPGIAEGTLIAPYNDLETTGAIIETYAKDLAAIIVEPLHRCIPPEPGFLEGLRKLADRTGAALIFDEVVTGFRLAPGGAAEYYGVAPDLVAYGKALGGGFPIGAYGGRADLMDVVAEDRLPGPRYVWSASTGGGNPVCAAAALATLNVLDTPGTYDHLHEQGWRLRARMRSALLEAGETAVVPGDGPIGQVAFTASAIRNSRDWQATDRERGRALMLALIREGVFLNPMGTKLYLSIAHDDEALDRFEGAFRAALKSLPEQR